MKKLLFIISFLSLAITVPAQVIPMYSWAGKIGNSGYETSWDMTSDNAGNVFITGQFDGICDFDPGNGTYNLTSTGWASAFIAKYTGSGNLVWAKSIGGTLGASGIAISVDNNGNVFFTGNFSGQIDIDPGPGITTLNSNGADDIFFAKCDTSGDLIWGKTIGEDSYESVTDIQLDNNGFFYLTGSYSSDSLDLDPGPGFATQINNNFSADPILAKYDTSGNFIWGFGLEGLNDNSTTSITINAAQDVIIGGYFSGTLTVNVASGTILTAPGLVDCFLISYSSNGLFNWAVAFGGPQYESLNSLHSKGNDIYATGYFQGLVDFDPGPDTLKIQSNGFNDAYLARFNATGQLQWAGGIGGTDYDEAMYIHVNNAGDVYIAGHFTDSADFDTGAGVAKLKSYGARDAFLAKYDSSGNYVWAMKIGSSDWDNARGLTFDNNSNEVWTTGYYGNSSCYVDPMNMVPPLPATLGGDIFFAKYGECSFPVNTGQPATQNLCAGENANFNVSFNGNTLTYQWQEGTNGGTTWTDITNGGVYSGATTTNLTLSGVTGSFNNRFYRCIATESCGLSLTSGTGILFVTTADTSVTVNQHILIANATTALYQWLDCNNGLSPITGATAKQFIPSVPGSYAVIVTKNGCTDTSACITVTTIGVDELIADNEVLLFPVPANEHLNIKLNATAVYQVGIYDISGRILQPVIEISNKVAAIDLSTLESGTYLIGIRKNKGAERYFPFEVSR